MTIAIILIILIFIIFSKGSNNNTRQISAKMYQMLETLDIINQTVKYDVFVSRMDFLKKLALSIPIKEDNSKCEQIAFKNYTKKTGRNISPTQRLVITKPQIAYSPSFKDEANLAFFMRTCDKFGNEIIKLKTSAAKQRRVQQAIDLSDVIIYNLSSPDNSQFISAIEETLTQLKHKASPSNSTPQHS